MTSIVRRVALCSVIGVMSTSAACASIPKTGRPHAAHASLEPSVRAEGAGTSSSTTANNTDTTTNNTDTTTNDMATTTNDMATTPAVGLTSLPQPAAVALTQPAGCNGVSCVPSVLPEASANILLPVVGVAVLGGASLVVLRRRRSSSEGDGPRQMG
jgi:LPXTG-motif cell wall-anchored protein